MYRTKHLNLRNSKYNLQNFQTKVLITKTLNKCKIQKVKDCQYLYVELMEQLFIISIVRYIG